MLNPTNPRTGSPAHGAANAYHGDVYRTVPTFKTPTANAVIGCNIRPGMTPGGMMTSLALTDKQRNEKRVRKYNEVNQAAMAFLENRVVRT
jgi:hypothetical protein